MFKKNKIYKIDKNGKKKRIFSVKGLKIKFIGYGSTIVFHEPIGKFIDSKITLGSFGEITFKGSNNEIKRLTILAPEPFSCVDIGENLFVSTSLFLALHCAYKPKITIGEDCMFGASVVIRCSDGHAILEKGTTNILNNDGHVTIGNHVWFCKGCTILKGVNIADNCIIGTQSLVNRDCNVSNSIYAGVPAKLVKENIDWDRQPIFHYLQNVVNNKKNVVFYKKNNFLQNIFSIKNRYIIDIYNIRKKYKVITILGIKMRFLVGMSL